MSKTFADADQTVAARKSAGAWVPTRRAFRDEALQREFEAQGVVVVRLLEADQAKALYGAFLRLEGERSFFNTVVDKALPNHHTQTSQDRNYRESVEALVRDAVSDRLREVLPEFRVISAGIVVKSPGGRGTPLHCDWTLTPDPDDVTITVWCPLIDVDRSNGGLQVVRGSHRLVQHITGPKIRDYHLPFQREMTEYAVSIPLEAGEALVFDCTVLHGSPENSSDLDRPALMLSCVPENTEPVYYRPASDSDPSSLEVLSWPSDGYVGSEVESLRAAEAATVSNPNRPIAYEDYMRLFAERTGRQVASGSGSLRKKVIGLFRRTRP